MKILSAIAALLLILSSSAQALLISDGAGGYYPAPGAAPDPLLTIAVATDVKGRIVLTGKHWVNLKYAGSGACKARFMNNTSASGRSLVAVSVGTNSSLGRYIHANSKFMSYSACNSSTIEFE